MSDAHDLHEPSILVDAHEHSVGDSDVPGA